MVELALTMKVKLTTNKHESEALNRLCDNYTSCCNEVSDWIGEHHTLSQRKINEAVYHPLRDKYGLLAQMTQSSIRRVIASYKAIHSRMERRNGENPKRKRTAYYSTRPKYSSAGVDLLWNRDYSYSSMTGMFSLPVMDGRIKVKANGRESRTNTETHVSAPPVSYPSAADGICIFPSPYKFLTLLQVRRPS